MNQLLLTNESSTTDQIGQMNLFILPFLSSVVDHTKVVINIYWNFLLNASLNGLFGKLENCFLLLVMRIAHKKCISHCHMTQTSFCFCLTKLIGHNASFHAGFKWPLSKIKIMQGKCK